MRFQNKVKVKETKGSSKYADISRTSIKKEIAKTVKVEKKESDKKRILQIKENSSYSKLARFIVGKLVTINKDSQFGGNSYSFVYEEDRQALNNAAGWSDNKKEYLFEVTKFKD